MVENDRFEDYRLQVNEGLQRIANIVTIQGEKFDELLKEIHKLETSIGSMEGQMKAQFTLMEYRLEALEKSKEKTNNTLMGMMVALVSGAILGAYNFLLNGGK